jgi:hypothetical protein
MARPYQQATVDRAKELRAAGVQVADIRRELGIPDSTIIRWTTPGSAAKQRATSHAWKERNRKALNAQNREYKIRKRRGEPLDSELRAVPDGNHECAGCGAPMLTASPSGMCGFCVEEQEMAA